MIMMIKITPSIAVIIIMMIIIIMMMIIIIIIVVVVIIIDSPFETGDFSTGSTTEQ